jgi:hypothetical protein
VRNMGRLRVWTRWENRATLAVALLLPLLGVAHSNQYFFTNTNDIRKLSNDQSEVQILYTDSHHPQALDFNSCKGSPGIYWISLLDGRIHRGNPDGGGQAEYVSSFAYMFAFLNEQQRSVIYSIVFRFVSLACDRRLQMRRGNV